MKLTKPLAVILVAMLFGLCALLVASIMLPFITHTVDAISPTLATDPNANQTYVPYLQAIMGFIPFFFYLAIVFAIIGAIAAGGAT